MTVLGSNCVVLSYTGKECEVSPYSSEYEAVWNIHVATGATVWTNTMDGMAYLLTFHESLWMGDKLYHTLVNPNQLQAYGVSFLLIRLFVQVLTGSWLYSFVRYSRNTRIFVFPAHDYI